MPWTESHTVLIRHRKVVELATALRIRPSHAIGHLHALWHAALEQQEDGDLSAWSDEFIAQASDYPGDAPQYVRLLQKHRWLDDKLIHDWLDYAGRYLEAKYKTSNPKRLSEIRAKHVRKIEVEPQSNRSQTRDGPPDSTHLTHLTHPPNAGARARRLHGIPATVEEVIAYGASINPKVDESRCRAFWSHYEGQARTGPSGDVFWVTGSEHGTVVTNWKVKLPAFGHQTHGTNRTNNRPAVDRNAGTSNANRIGQYDGIGRVK